MPQLSLPSHGWPAHTSHQMTSPQLGLQDWNLGPPTSLVGALPLC